MRRSIVLWVFDAVECSFYDVGRVKCSTVMAGESVFSLASSHSRSGGKGKGEGEGIGSCTR
jgi:hypothetical protein